MHRVIVIQAKEDQHLARIGRVPGNHIDREFATEGEASAYVDGVESMADLVEAEILGGSETSVLISFDSDEQEIKFGSAAEKAAYLEGIDDGDGFEGAACFSEENEEFEVVAGLVGGTTRVP